MSDEKKGIIENVGTQQALTVMHGAALDASTVAHQATCSTIEILQEVFSLVAREVRESKNLEDFATRLAAAKAKLFAASPATRKPDVPHPDKQL